MKGPLPQELALPDTAQSIEPDGTTRSIRRALMVLRVLNEREIWALQDLQKRTGLPKSTLHRLLSTLQAERYVYSGEETHGRYRLTQNVRNLSSGYVEKNRLADIAGPLVIAATKKSRWPMAVAVIDGTELRANVCTMPYSPYSMKPTCFGQRYDLLSSALGTAYMAYCSSNERRILLALLREKHGRDALPSPAAVHAFVRTVRRRGYGLRMGQTSNESSAIAVPIQTPEGETVGSLACSTFAQSIDPAWIDRNLAVIRHTAGQIGKLYGKT